MATKRTAKRTGNKSLARARRKVESARKQLRAAEAQLVRAQSAKRKTRPRRAAKRSRTTKRSRKARPRRAAKRRRPPREWMRRCEGDVRETGARDPGAVCGATWYRRMSSTGRRAAKREYRD